MYLFVYLLLFVGFLSLFLFSINFIHVTQQQSLSRIGDLRLEFKTKLINIYEKKAELEASVDAYAQITKEINLILVPLKECVHTLKYNIAWAFMNPSYVKTCLETTLGIFNSKLISMNDLFLSNTNLKLSMEAIALEVNAMFDKAPFTLQQDFLRILEEYPLLVVDCKFPKINEAALDPLIAIQRNAVEGHSLSHAEYNRILNIPKFAIEIPTDTMILIQKVNLEADLNLFHFYANYKLFIPEFFVIILFLVSLVGLLQLPFLYVSQLPFLYVSAIKNIPERDNTTTIKNIHENEKKNTTATFKSRL